MKPRPPCWKASARWRWRGVPKAPSTGSWRWISTSGWWRPTPPAEHRPAPHAPRRAGQRWSRRRWVRRSWVLALPWIARVRASPRCSSCCFAAASGDWAVAAGVGAACAGAPSSSLHAGTWRACSLRAASSSWVRCSACSGVGRLGLPALLRVVLATVACLVGVRAFDAFFPSAVAVADFWPAVFRGAFVAEAVLPDATFRVATFPVGDFLAAVLFAGVFLAAAFFATTFFAAAVLTVAFFAAVFFTGALRALPLPDALLFVAGARVADFLVAAFFAARAGAADL